jgi:hypothetical protein
MSQRFMMEFPFKKRPYRHKRETAGETRQPDEDFWQISLFVQCGLQRRGFPGGGVLAP